MNLFITVVFNHKTQPGNVKNISFCGKSYIFRHFRFYAESFREVLNTRFDRLRLPCYCHVLSSEKALEDVDQSRRPMVPASERERHVQVPSGSETPLHFLGHYAR